MRAQVTADHQDELILKKVYLPAVVAKIHSKSHTESKKNRKEVTIYNYIYCWISDTRQ